jgi:uncharacterized protein (DUF433 family)
MATAWAPVNHIRIGPDNQAWIEGTPYRVLDIVLDHLVHGFSAEEIQFQHYGVPSLAQIHAALAYYYDHQAELDNEIERQVKSAEALKAQSGESPIVKRLKAEGKIP